MLDRVDETIVAISSAPGAGRVGIVRLSGPRSIDIVARMVIAMDATAIRDAHGSTRVVCRLAIPPCGEIPAACYVFRRPRSYTRQDSVEIHTIGSPAVLESVRRGALELGALGALPGEFTARAFVSGAMGLAAAEAVAGVIRARSDTQLAAARRMMGGALARRIADTRDELAELLALVEADIDFADEPIEFIAPSDARTRLASLQARLNNLLTGSMSIERFDVLPRILLLGRPNAGKSTLMNALSGTSRSICAAAAGTTRDILSAPTRLGRGEAILLDTAGVDESDDRIVSAARAMVLSEVERVDLVCLVIDLTNPELDRVRDLRAAIKAPCVVVANKRDAVDDSAEHAFGASVIRISALTGAGLDELRAALADALADQTTTALGESMLISERQEVAIRDATGAVGRASTLCASAKETIDCADLLAFELREALAMLGSVTGDVATEDLLGQVFAKFCIGK